MDNVEYNIETKKYQYKNHNLIDNIDIHSNISDFDKTQNQVLKLLIYTLVKENNNLKRNLEDVSIRYDISNNMLYHLGLNMDNFSTKCLVCDIWFEDDKNGAFYCNFCESSHCGSCHNIIKCHKCNSTISYTNCIDKILTDKHINVEFANKIVKKFDLMMSIKTLPKCWHCVKYN